MIRACSGLAQCVRWSRTIGIWPTVTVRQAITGLPALQRPGIKASQSTGRGKPCTVGAGLRDISHQDLAVFQAGHTSSPSLKTAAIFLREQARQPFRPGPCPCGAVRVPAPSPGADPDALPQHWPHAARPDSAIASCFQASSSAGYSPCSRLQALRVASSIAAVAMTACSRAAAVQRWLPPPGPLARASARQRSNVAVLTPTSRETTSTAELSGGSSRATILSLYACPYRATACYPRPQRFRSYPRGNCSDTGGPPRGCTSYFRGTGAGFRQPLTPPDPQLRWRT